MYANDVDHLPDKEVYGSCNKKRSSIELIEI